MRCTTALLALILAACSAGEASQPTPQAKRQQRDEQRQRVSDDRAREEVNSVTHRLIWTTRSWAPTRGAAARVMGLSA
jgi:hypothetical protein